MMNPCLILGPMLPGQPHLNTSSNALIGYVVGESSIILIGYLEVIIGYLVALIHSLGTLQESRGETRTYLCMMYLRVVGVCVYVGKWVRCAKCCMRDAACCVYVCVCYVRGAAG